MATIKASVFKDDSESVKNKLISCDISPKHSAYKYVKECIALLEGIHKLKKKELMDVTEKLNELLDKISDKAELPKLKKQIINAAKSRRYASSKIKITVTKAVAEQLQSSVASYLNKRKVSYQVAVSTLLELAADKLPKTDKKSMIDARFSGVTIVPDLGPAKVGVNLVSKSSDSNKEGDV